jgi:hypothetical protein
MRMQVSYPFVNIPWSTFSLAFLRHQNEDFMLPDCIFVFKNPNFGIFWRALIDFIAIWNILLLFGIFYCYLEYFIAILNILLLFGIFYCHLVYFTVIWNILWLIGIFLAILVC